MTMTKHQLARELQPGLNALFGAELEAYSLLDIYKTAEIVNMSRSTIYRRWKKGTFPAPRKVKSPYARGPRTVNRWLMMEVLDWMMEEKKYYDSLKEKALENHKISHVDPTVPDKEYYEEPEQSKWRIKPMFITAAIVGAICGILWGISH